MNVTTIHELIVILNINDLDGKVFFPIYKIKLNSGGNKNEKSSYSY